jgi:hypothetical protein
MLARMSDADIAQLVVGVLGVLAGAVAAFFAWRAWEGSRRIVQLRLAVERDHERAGGQWGVVVTARCRRGSAWIGGLSLQGRRAGLAVRGRSPVADSVHGVTLTEGTELSAFWPQAEFRSVDVDRDARACWHDAEERHHCTAIPKDVRRRLWSDDPGS